MSKNKTETDHDAADILALGRMVSYACQRAQSMKLDFSTYCLELALTSLIQDMTKAGVALPANEPPAGDFARPGLH
ncbi:hypothetical protein [Rhizobium terrae]|uniref:hypothetical protein n=1 Tax=Rhizobium terrae TaxID=2171756 RepID=UPI000E3D54CE|nr:hypothetical protein [Rhizobium terrae]